VLKDAEEREIVVPVEKLVVNFSPQTANAIPGEISSNMARESRVRIYTLCPSVAGGGCISKLR